MSDAADGRGGWTQCISLQPVLFLTIESELLRLRGFLERRIASAGDVGQSGAVGGGEIGRLSVTGSGSEWRCRGGADQRQTCERSYIHAMTSLHCAHHCACRSPATSAGRTESGGSPALLCSVSCALAAHPSTSALPIVSLCVVIEAADHGDDVVHSGRLAD